MDRIKGIDDALRSGIETTTLKGDGAKKYVDELKARYNITEPKNLGQTVSVSAPKPMAEEAFWGLAGEAVRSIMPHTEADQQAILIQFLAIFGNMVGPSPHFFVEQTKHGTKLYLLIVGESAKGRKGTSLNQCLSLFDDVDEHWFQRCRESGLSSSEGLIFRVRDPVVEIKTETNSSGESHTSEKITDVGIEDKRLLVVEAEFTSVLRNFKREGNKLSHIVREAFDGGKLHALTKNNPLVSTGSHISIIGHVTKHEMLKHLDEVEIANGFANRFLFCYAKRSKLLPDGGAFEGAALCLLKNQISRAVNFAKNVGRMERDEAARKYWHDIYPFLSEADPGMFGSIIARREALVLRLSVIYALLDESSVIREEHLRSALAVWQYSEESARYFFGEKLGDALADELLLALKYSDTGLTRTEIRDYFQRNKKKAQLDKSFALLLDRGLIHVTKNSAGVEVWKYGPAPEPSGQH